jgi:hypothetical protein
MRKIAIENPDNSYPEDNTSEIAAPSSPSIETFSFEQEAETFAEYTRQVSN